MSPLELQALLQRLALDLHALDAPWAIIGSAALVIAGVPGLDCPDLDILTTRAGAEALERAWAMWRRDDYVPDPAAPFRSRFSRYGFPEGEAEVMGELEFRGQGGWSAVWPRALERRRFGEAAWPVPTLDEQIRILRLFGRPKDLAKAARLEAFRTGG